jgi:outer membrane protein assembly factor BamB
VGASVTSVLAVAALGLWLTSSSRVTLAKSVPGLDGKPPGAAGAGSRANIGELFTAGEGTAADYPGEWTRFRGAGFDGVADAKVALADAWPASGPRAVWSLELGEGYAAPVVSGGRVYLLDYDESRRADSLRCLSLADGQEIWRRAYRVAVKRNHGFSRAIPAVADGYVVSIGPEGQVMCVDAFSGSLSWGIDLKADYGAEIPLWHTGQCALIDRGVAVIAVGAGILMMGVDCRTGAVVWSTPNPGAYGMSHSSIMPVTIAGTRTYVYCALGAVVGVSAEPASRGELLWQVKEWNPRVVAPSPVSLGGGRIYVTAGYGAGGALLSIDRTNTGFEGRVVSRWSPRQGFASEQQTPVFWRGSLYGILPKDAGEAGGELVCATPEGAMKWRSGKGNRFGLGPYLIADGKILVLSDDGVLTMARASAERYEPLAQAKVLSGRDAWGPLCLAGRYLLARDTRRLVCLDLGV